MKDFSSFSLPLAALLASSATYVRSLPQEVTSATVPSLTFSTAVPSATADANVPAQVAVPPTQNWCPSEIFCAGPLMQTLHLAHLYADPKTYVDKPTTKAPETVVSDFQSATQDVSPIPLSVIETFVQNDFGSEGLELGATALEGYKEEPAFLANVSDPVMRGFAQTVHSYWPQLARNTNESTLCDGVECASSLIPLNHTFVVPGGRFREQYYWDSFWIVEGLLESELYAVAKDTLLNFMDELDTYGFIPNGGRIYYLNRSQPPLFIQMLARYVEVSGDESILDRAVPLAQKELEWWSTNRMINVTSPTTGKIHEMARYNVDNTAPRPESYYQDYMTANPDGEEVLSEDERSQLYAELASGAESGWDFSSRWMEGTGDLTKLQIRAMIPVCLNSILYRDYMLLSELVDSDETARSLKSRADELKEGVLDLLWNPTKLAYYDFNFNTNQQSEIFTVASFYPLWSGITAPELVASVNNAYGHFATLNLVMQRYNGTYPSTFLETGQQWDAPNSWPPHNYIILKALSALPENVTSSGLYTSTSSFSLIPDGQLGLTEEQLPSQPISSSSNATSDISSMEDGLTVRNGGNSESGEGWADGLGRMLANRYVASAFCSWRATGGSIPDILPRLSDEELNVTLSINNAGHMFEKFSAADVDSAGRGGEYTVQAGFGWTNGVALWIASNYGSKLVAPQCPDLLASAEIFGTGNEEEENSAGILKPTVAVLFGAVATLWSLL